MANKDKPREVASAPEPAAPAVESETSKRRNYPAWLRRTYRWVGRALVVTSLPEIMLITTLCYSRYLQNSDFSYPSEVILDIVLLSVISTVIFYVLRLGLRNWRAAHLASLPLAYALYAYNYSFPGLHHLGNLLIPKGATTFTHVMLQLLLLVIVFGAVGFIVDWLFRRVRHLRAVPLLKFVLFVVVFIFAAEAYKVGARMWTIRKDLTYKQPAFSFKTNGQQPASKPDVYYLLFDRYANATTLKQDYNFDNSPLLSDLAAQGFVTRDDAYANYPFTMQSISSTLAADYHTQVGKEFDHDADDFQTAFPYRAILDNSPVAQAFKKAGYNYNQVSSWWDFTRNVPGADDEPTKSFKLHAFGKDFWLTDLQRDIVNKSILSPLLLKGVSVGHTAIVKYTLDRNPLENFDAQMNALKTIAGNSATEKQPQFTFAHILSPHDPYIFDADCNTPTYDSNRTDNGVDETVKYTNQVTCDNKYIESVISTIRTKDPGAAIVLQADEGPYPKQFRGTLTPGHYYDPINLPLQQMRQKFGVLASYYMPGVDSQTVQNGITSSVNAFRFVLSHYLNYDLPDLPDCQFATGDKYNLYNYQQVTGALNGTQNPPACSQYQ